MSKQNYSQTLDSADTSHSNICISRDGHDLDMSVERTMLHCTNFQPAVDAQLLRSNSSIPATENEMNNSNSTHDHEHNMDMQKVKGVLKITEFKQFQIECAAAVKHGQDAIVVQ